MREDLIGIYPGAFDPITNGHMDVITKAIAVVDELVIALAEDAGKNTAFTVKERIEMIEVNLESIAGKIPPHKKIRTVAFSGLLVDFVRSQKSNLIIRGLRAVSDFEYEFQMAAMNYKVASDVQTIFVPAVEKSQFIASRIVKEMARLGADISGFVSPFVDGKLRAKYR